MLASKKKFLHAIIIVLIIYSVISPLNAALFDSPYKKIAKLIAQKANEKNKVKIAVLTFQSLDDQTTNFGEIISEEIIVELVNNSSLNVVERSQVEKLLKELQFNQTGAIDAAAAKKIGNGLGADALVIGSFTSVSSSQFKLYTKLVDTETFQVLAASQELVKKDMPKQEFETQKEVRRESPPSSWSNFEIGFMSGINIPTGTISTDYTIDTTSYLFLGTTVENSLNGIHLSSSIPLVFRSNIWYGPVFGTGFDFGYSTYRFSTQTILGTSTLKTDFPAATQSTSQTVNITQNDYYQLNNLYLSANFLMRIPISPRFYPYLGIGYKISGQWLSHTGSSSDIYDPLTENGFGLEFGYSSSLASIQGLLNLFTYMVGIQWYIIDNIGIQAEYQLMNYGDTQYLALGSNFSHVDPNWGDLSGNSGYSLNMTLSSYSVHIFHIAVMFKFE